MLMVDITRIIKRFGEKVAHCFSWYYTSLKDPVQKGSRPPTRAVIWAPPGFFMFEFVTSYFLHAMVLLAQNTSDMNGEAMHETLKGPRST